MTMIDPGKPAVDPEEEHRREVARDALASLTPELRGKLFDEEGIQEMLEAGNWRGASSVLGRRGQYDLSALLRLATPFGLEL